MDNISHTIAGCLVAEAAIQWRRARGSPPTPRFERALYVVSALANNLPDFDFLYTGITQPSKLGYLLHHRGHTHTLGVALLSALFFLALGWLFARRLGRGFARDEWRLLWGLGLVGAVLHIAMDFTNNYGVHPFWPLYSGWFYGDFVFIVEPLFFALGVPPLLFALRARAARVLFGAILAAILAAVWFVPFIPVLVALIVTAVSALALFIAKTQGGARPILFTFAAALSVAATGFALRFRAQSAATAGLPGSARLEDVVLTPMPGNPLCWSVWRVSVQGEQYVADRGVAAPIAALLPAERCTMEPDGGGLTAPVVVREVRESAALRWVSQYRAPLSELGALARDDCRAAALLRFARVPYWAWHAPTGGPPRFVMGDLRYDRTPEIEFAEIELEGGVGAGARDCPRFVPDWIPPRHRLTGSSRHDTPR